MSACDYCGYSHDTDLICDAMFSAHSVDTHSTKVAKLQEQVKQLERENAELRKAIEAYKRAILYATDVMRDLSVSHYRREFFFDAINAADAAIDAARQSCGE